MFTTIKAVFGGIMLFGGRNLHWAFAAGLGYFVGQRLTENMTRVPFWVPIAISATIALIGLIVALAWEEGSYFVTGFLFGGYILLEFGSLVATAFFHQGLKGPDWLIFTVGALIGSLLIGFTKAWGIMFATAATGAFLFSDMFNVTPLIKSMIAGGLFVVGGLAQALILNLEAKSRR